MSYGIFTFHPAFLLKGAQYYHEVVVADLDRARRIAEAGSWEQTAKIYKLLPNGGGNVSVDWAINWLNENIAKNIPVATDTETYGVGTRSALDQYSCKLHALGVSFSGSNEALSLLADGTLGYDNTRRLLDVIRRLFGNDTPKYFHNRSYDFEVLRRHGLQVGGPFFDCHLDSATEFLTYKGWKKYDEITCDDLLATFTPEGKLNFEKYTDRFSDLYTGDLLSVESRHSKCVVTPNHKLWLNPFRRAINKSDGWRFLEAEKCTLSEPDQAYVRVSCSPDDVADNGSPHVVPPKLIGLFIADGGFNFSKGELYDAYVSQQIDGKGEEYLHKIKDTLNLTTTTSVHDESWRGHVCYERRWYIRDKIKVSWLYDQCGRYSKIRKLPADFISWSVEDREQLLEGLCSGDGSLINKSVFNYRTSSKALANDVQVLALSLGYAATISSPTDEGIYFVLLTFTQQDKIFTRDQTQRNTNTSISRIQVVDERIVCFTVPSHKLITRCAGKVSFHGNSVVMHHLTDPELDHDLGFVSHQFLDTDPWKIEYRNLEKKGNNSLERLLYYNGRDTLATQQICEILYKRIIDIKQEHIAQHEFRLNDLAGKMGRTGIPIDEVKRLAIEEKLTFARDEALEFIRSTMKWSDFDPQKPKHRFELVYGRLKLPVRFYTKKKAEPSTGRRALIAHLSEPVIRAVMKFDENAKLLSTFVRKLPKMVDEGRLHPHWNSVGTVGSRWSSSDPNFQNWRKFLREIVTTRPGRILVGADSKAIEYRIVACLSGCAKLVSAFNENRDVHSEVSAELFGRSFTDLDPKDKIRKDLRDLGKRVVYARNYRAQPKTICENLKQDPKTPMSVRAILTPAYIERLSKNFDRAYPEIGRWAEAEWDKANRTGQQEIIPLGRIRYHSVLPVEDTKSANVPAQDAAGDFQGLSMLAVDEKLPKGADLILNVHDQIVCECDVKDAERVKTIIEEAMLHRITGPAGSLMLEGEGDINVSWDKV